MVGVFRACSINPKFGGQVNGSPRRNLTPPPRKTPVVSIQNFSSSVIFLTLEFLKKKFKLKLKEKEALILFHHDQCIRTTIKKES